MRQYLELIKEIFENGSDAEGRNGFTRRLFARQLRFNLRDGFPVPTTKQFAFKSMKGELLWFIEGGRKTNWRMDESRLREILGYPPEKMTAWTIWSGDANSNRWKPYAKFEGDCGRIYGSIWRHWETVDGRFIDQLAVAIDSIKNDPWDRKHKIVTARDVGALDDMCLEPCHERFQFFVTPGPDGKPKYLSIQMTQRSCDTFLGVPFNIASYALLLAMVAQVTGLEPLELVIDFIDVHIYSNHFDQVREQLTREPLPLPTLRLNPEVTDIDSFTMDDINLVDYRHHGPIKAELAKDKSDL